MEIHSKQDKQPPCLQVPTSFDCREEFARALRQTLVSRFGRLPSAAFVAREFNIRAYGCEPITQESARRWLRGLSVPAGNRLGVLQKWLDIDLNRIFNLTPHAKTGFKEKIADASENFGSAQAQKDNSADSGEINLGQGELQPNIIEIFNHLSPAHRSILYIIAQQFYQYEIQSKGIDSNGVELRSESPKYPRTKSFQ